MTFTALTVVAIVATLLVAVVLHEVSHAYVAYAFGDTTARDAGRLSLNPVRHIDPFGTIVLPGLLIALSLVGLGSGVVFGWAKPVPVSRSGLRRPRTQMLLVALAGPATNLVLATLGVLLLRGGVGSEAALDVLGVWIILNVTLFVFNMLPVPPLDGSEVVAWLLPGGARRAFLGLQRYGVLVLLAVIWLFPSIFRAVVRPLVAGLLRVLLA